MNRRSAYCSCIGVRVDHIAALLRRCVVCMYGSKQPMNWSIIALNRSTVDQFYTHANVITLAGITILLSLSVFQLIVAEAVPATSLSVPLIGGLHTVVTLLTCLLPCLSAHSFSPSLNSHERRD